MQADNDQDSEGWAYKPEADAETSTKPAIAEATEPLLPAADEPPVAGAAHNQDAVTWTASEYLSHEKGLIWFFGFGVVTMAVVGLVYLLSRNVLSVVIIAMAALSFGIFALRKPRVLTYKVDSHGITIAGKFHPYELFKSFSMHQDGAAISLDLMPIKRLNPDLTIYVAPDQVDKVVDVIGAYLPNLQRRRDWIDQLMHQLRF